MNKDSVLLGILGGLGPMSSVYFCEMLTAHTHALCDAEHINFLLSSRADTPDRSAFILGRSDDDPSPVMAREAKRLQDAGVQLIAIPCNTAHYFYEKICDAVTVPIINIISETARFCSYEGIKKVGVLATEGTAASGAYSEIFTARGIDIEPLTADEQSVLTKIIFDQIKRGTEPSVTELLMLAGDLRSRGCERLILGCTELSLIKKNYTLPGYFIDSLELLALEAIKRCGRQPIGFDDRLMQFAEMSGKDE